MRAIIYYSLSSKTKNEVLNRFEGDFYRIKGKIKIPRNYFIQLAWLGFLSTINLKLNYEDLNIDYEMYDEIVLACPVWAFTIVPFMKKFLIENSIKNKKVILLITHAGGPRNAMKHFYKYVDKSNKIIEELSIQKGVSYEKNDK